MKKGLLIFLAALLVTVAILITWLTVTESGLRWAYQEAKPYLPFKLTVNKLHGRLIGPITITGVMYQQDEALIKADQIDINWKPSSLLAGKVNISHINVQTFDIVLPKVETTDQALLLPEIRLPWRVELKDAEINGISINQNGQSFRIKQVNLDATTLFSRVEIKKLDIIADDFQINIKGELQSMQNYRHDLVIRWEAELPSHTIIKGSGQLTGDMKSSRIKQQLSAPTPLTLDGKVNDLLNQPYWQANLHAEKFDLTQLNTDWPTLTGTLTLNAKGDFTTATLTGIMKGEHPDLGSLNADLKLQQLSDKSIQIDQLKLHAPRDDTLIDASGLWRPGNHGGAIKLALNWKNLRWFSQNQLWFNSAHGNGTLEGNVNSYQVNLNSDSPWSDILPSAWQVSAEGNLDGLKFHSLRVKALKGEAVATGQLSWTPKLSWTAKVNATDINPAGLWPEWPGHLKGKLTSTGRFENGQWMADADVTQVSGKLRGYPVSLHSRLNWRDNNLEIAQLEFLSGSTKVNLHGMTGNALKLNWSMASNNLSELYPDAKGRFHAKGMLSGPWATPFIEASFSGKALKILTYGASTIEGKIAVNLHNWQKIDINLAAQTLKLDGYALRSLDINTDKQGIKATAVSETATATAHVELSEKPQAKGWHGRLVRADIRSKKFTDWQLSAPVSFNISDKSIVADTLCWHSNKEGKLCTTINRKNTTWHSRTEINKLPLMLFTHWLPPELKLNSTANATAVLQFQKPDQLLGHIQIELPSGSVSYPVLEGERDQWEYRSGKVKVVITPKGLEANTEIAMKNGDQFKAQLSLPGAKPLTIVRQRQPLKASALLNIHDLGLIESIVPEIQDLKGQVALNIIVAGTLAQPTLSGNAHLLKGTLRVPKLGLTIDQFNLKGESDNLEKFNFDIDAQSGNGKLTMQGHTTLNKNAGWPTVINIKGNNFEVARIPEAQVQVSPDLKIKLQKHTIDISGDIHIPYAKLQPKDTTSAARVSGDAVIIGGEQSTAPKWSITTRIRMTLGERVNFYGFGFEGLLGGSLLLEDKPGQLTKATGEINIPEGRYRAYGQRLEVDHGRLLFTGGLLTNPGLDLRAVRHVANITAGVKVKGSLKQPQLELFSTPAMGQTDVLSYLLLGRPIENASDKEGSMMTKAALALGLSGGDRIARLLGDQFGLDEMRVESGDNSNQTSLVMGRYLSPRLYVSYGVGLIEAINTLTVRYQISEKWQLKGESGEYQGADILYTIKR